MAVLLPNGTNEVTLSTRAGASLPLEVIANTVAFAAGDGDVLSWRGPEGRSFSSTLGV